MNIEQKEKFIVITAEDGMYVTNWDKENIEDFWASKKMFCPLNIDTEKMYEITDDEYNALEKEKEEKINKENIEE